MTVQIASELVPGMDWNKCQNKMDVDLVRNMHIEVYKIYNGICWKVITCRI